MRAGLLIKLREPITYLFVSQSLFYFAPDSILLKTEIKAQLNPTKLNLHSVIQAIIRFNDRLKH
jgi:hypothetical protein